jgi:diguanylate cyclase (GGDEF)-like protein
VAELAPESPPQVPLFASGDSPRHALLERGVSLRAAPDLTGFRQYLAARQRAEEIALAEAAIADGVTLGRGLLGRRRPQEVPDPQLRPVTWAVARRRNPPALRAEEIVGPFDLEDAHHHRGLVAHAYVVNADSAAPAVCGFHPRVTKIGGGAPLAELAAASLENNRRCGRCLVLLYQAALSGQPETGPWPTADAVAGEEQSAAEESEVDAAAAVDGEADVATEAAGDTLVAGDAGYIEVPIRPEYEGDLGEAGTDGAGDDATGEYDVGQEDVAAGERYAPAADYSEPEPDETEEAVAESAVAEAAAGYYSVGHEQQVIGLDDEEPFGRDAEVEPEAYADDEEIEVDTAFIADQVTVAAQADALEHVLKRGVDDVLVVTSAGRSALIIDGVGRGTDWAGSVLDTEQEPVLRRVWGLNQVLHHEGAEPQRICGPYWARVAVIVPLGESACVVFGSTEPLTLTEQELLDAARAAAERFNEPSLEGALEDEREISIALNRILESDELSFEKALDHVLSTTASLLGCSMAAGVARMGRRLAMRAIDLDGSDNMDPSLLLGGGPMLTGEQSVSVEEGLSAEGGLPGVVSRLRIPLNGANVQGLLVVTHTTRRPRGFTSQDHRLAETISRAAVLVLERAGFGEGLEVLESHMRSAPATDPLTGLANRAAWDEALASEADRIARSGGSAAVAAFRIDGLQRIDERQGPLARDAALRQASELVRSLSRSTDLAARVGDDEFRVLVRDGGNSGARRLAVRIRRAAREAQVGAAAPPLAISWANAQSRSQLLAAGRLVGQRLRSRTRSASDSPRLGSGRPN